MPWTNSIPPLPNSVQQLEDERERQRATHAWKQAHTLRNAIRDFPSWLSVFRMEYYTKGTYDPSNLDAICSAGGTAILILSAMKIRCDGFGGDPTHLLDNWHSPPSKHLDATYYVELGPEVKSDIWRRQFVAENATLSGLEAFLNILAESPPTAFLEDLPRKKPVWNSNTGELTFKGTVAKRIKNVSQAKNIGVILAAFQEEGWPPRIDDPLPDGRDQQRLGEAVDSLNRNLLGLIFSRDGTGEGIRWKEVT